MVEIDPEASSTSERSSYKQSSQLAGVRRLSKLAALAGCSKLCAIYDIRTNETTSWHYLDSRVEEVPLGPSAVT